MNATEQVGHTPGPWRLEAPRLRLGPTIWDADGIFICRLRGESPEQRANARLIAAAPEMLETLREIDRLASKVGRDAITTIARAVIAKAEGR